MDGKSSSNLFQGLPPPSAPPQPIPIIIHHETPIPIPIPIPIPPLKTALKRRSLPTSQPPPTQVLPVSAPEKKRARFKTTTDASETQVIEAMRKISSHIKNPMKFSKASKLAVQLIEASSVKAGTSDFFFSVLESAMSSPTACNDSSTRADYHTLFSAAQDAAEFFDRKKKNQLKTWVIRAVLANDLFTDDSFVFSKATGQIKEAITNLPVATKDEDLEEAAVLEDFPVVTETNNEIKEDSSLVTISQADTNADLDPFGLDALVSSTSKKEEKAKRKKEANEKMKAEERETKRYIKTQREALIACLEIASRRYRTPWCQTSIDILVKHAFDNISKFTSKQREAIDKLWASIREQQTRRKQGKSISGKLDVNGFEWLQEKYSNEKISIRHAVGGSGERRCTQWLG